MSIHIPEGLQTWNRRIAGVIQKPFPPENAPERREIPQWDKISNWAMICEEILDTVPDPGLLKQFHGELLRRGFEETEIQDMRHFAWLTAGWLNFEKMLWDWCSLDEADIKMAIEWQVKDGLIDQETASKMMAYMDEKDRKGVSTAPPNSNSATT